MKKIPSPSPPAPDTGATALAEAEPLARECARALGKQVAIYRQCYQHDDAVARTELDGKSYCEHVKKKLPDEVTWLELRHVANNDEQGAVQLWENVKEAARDELRSGFRAAKAVEDGRNGPFGRAQFLAIRSELLEEWQPRNGVERQLIDTMAIAQEGFLIWTHTLNMWTTMESFEDDRIKNSDWRPPRLRDAEAMDHAAAMADRFHRMFLRALRALRDLRRYATVIVQNAGQVNVAGQQVNVGG